MEKLHRARFPSQKVNQGVAAACFSQQPKSDPIFLSTGLPSMQQHRTVREAIAQLQK